MDSPDLIPIIVIFRPGTGLFGKKATFDDYLVSRLDDILTQNRFSFEILRPATLTEAAEMARKALETYRLVAAAGGDGTINAVASGIAGSDCCLGILPLGSGNDIARGLHIPQKLPDAVRLLKAGLFLLSETRTPGTKSNSLSAHDALKNAPIIDANQWDAKYSGLDKRGSGPKAIIHKMDVGNILFKEATNAAYDACSETDSEHGKKFSNTCFINTLGIGFDGKVAWNASKIRFLSGSLKYFGGVLQSLFTYRASDMTVAVNGNTYRGRFLMATVANGPFEGGGIPIAPLADPTDGAFHLVLIRETGLHARIPLLLRVMRGRAEAESRIIHAKCTSAKIETALPLTVHADGEVITRSLTEITATIRPASLLVIGGASHTGA